MAIDVDKLALLTSISTALAGRELGDVNLLLHEIGLDDLYGSVWYGDEDWEPTDADRAHTVLMATRDLGRAEVFDLADAVHRLFQMPVEVPERHEPDPLCVFASHLANQAAVVGAVGKELAQRGVKLFVAHDSIAPDSEWASEIERVLQTCHAGVAFIAPGFSASQWCDQEVGWLLGRGVPCLALKFQGQSPYGPLGRKQALVVQDGTTAQKLADEIIAWLRMKPALAGNLNRSLIDALKGSINFSQTDNIWASLYSARDMTEKQVAGLLTAIRDNDQVYNASGGVTEKGPYSELAFKLALQQPGFDANEAFAAEVAGMRGLEGLLPPETNEGGVGGAGQSVATSGGPQY
ncbi:toll/interleukin-1 receptor domain-containing protein [Mumia sp. zg.B21]|uniref:toll/interleukin-1 receptor domain-containing protein n=1 Tax=Mumia sp. zg.B21 TaxID=2855447 RepID=UPI001C6F32E8|nr:toll/interleukin-1 receptor domain-containing protein [Mumia sp. zg.B21]MBW9210112.1 toll/interleukin-1 receptor domain-containing protein [Mumia sp. zg.B21]